MKYTKKIKEIWKNPERKFGHTIVGTAVSIGSLVYALPTFIQTFRNPERHPQVNFAKDKSSNQNLVDMVGGLAGVSTILAGTIAIPYFIGHENFNEALITTNLISLGYEIYRTIKGESK